MKLKAKRAVAAKKKNRASETIQPDDVLRIHKEVLNGSLKSQNYAALEELYSDDYMLVRPDGSVLNKQEVLQDLRTNGLTFHCIDLRENKVRIYGPTAVKAEPPPLGTVWRLVHTFDSLRSMRARASRSGLCTFKAQRFPIEPAAGRKIRRCLTIPHEKENT